MCEKEKFLYLKYIHLRQIYLDKIDKPVSVSIMPLLDESKHFPRILPVKTVWPQETGKSFQKMSLKGSLWLQLGGIAVHHDIVSLVA